MLFERHRGSTSGITYHLDGNCAGLFHHSLAIFWKCDREYYLESHTIQTPVSVSITSSGLESYNVRVGHVISDQRPPFRLLRYHRIKASRR